MFLLFLGISYLISIKKQTLQTEVSVFYTIYYLFIAS